MLYSFFVVISGCTWWCLCVLNVTVEEHAETAVESIEGLFAGGAELITHFCCSLPSVSPLTARTLGVGQQPQEVQ